MLFQYCTVQELPAKLKLLKRFLVLREGSCHSSTLSETCDHCLESEDVKAQPPHQQHQSLPPTFKVNCVYAVLHEIPRYICKASLVSLTNRFQLHDVNESSAIIVAD